jgi:hypothetical protein
MMIALFTYCGNNMNTDGEVTNADEVVAEVRQNAHMARVFTFGIGKSVSHSLVSWPFFCACRACCTYVSHLLVAVRIVCKCIFVLRYLMMLARLSQVKSIARAGNGECEFVTENENISDKVLRQISRALQPAMCNISVDWKPLESVIKMNPKDGAEGEMQDEVQMAPKPVREHVCAATVISL